MKHDEANLHFLLHSAALIRDLVQDELRALGVGHSQARVLDALDRMGPSSQARLAKELNITAPSMSTMAMRMLVNGQIARQPDPQEKRSNILRLSEPGETLLAQVRAAWHRVDHTIREKMGDERAAILFEVNRELRDALGGRSPGDGHR